MKKIKRAAAFTLTEILVVLVISVLVVGLAFSVLDLVQKSFTGIRDNYAYSTEVKHLKQQMTIDFNRFHEIRFDQVAQKLYLKNELDSVVYLVENKMLLRNADTIPVPVEEVRLYFTGNEVVGGKVDAIKILTERPTGSFLFISKINSSKTFFDRWE